MEEKKVILVLILFLSLPAFAYDEVELSLGVAPVTVEDGIRSTSVSFQVWNAEIKKYLLNKEDINFGLSLGGSFIRNETLVKTYLFYPAVFANRYFNKYLSPEVSLRFGFAFYEEKNSAASLREDWGRYMGIGVKNYFEVNDHLSLFLSLFYQTLSFNKTDLRTTTPSVGINYSF